MLFVVMAIGSLSGDALARTYTVHSCRTPDGRPAGTSQWTVQGRRGDVATGQDCARGGAIYLRFGPGTAVSYPQALWVFTAPPDTEIASYAIYRHVRAHVGDSPGHASAYSLYHDVIWGAGDDSCGPYTCPQPGNPGVPLDRANRVSRQTENVRRLLFEFVCWRSDSGGGCPRWSVPGLYIYAAEIELSDTLEPAITSVAGTLATSGPHYGRRSLIVRANDRGSGLYGAALVVDGQSRAVTMTARTHRLCSRPFRDARPCPLAVEIPLELDTARLPDGLHRLSVVTWDAAGNATQVGPYRLPINNGGGTCIYGSGPRLRAGLGRRGRRSLRTRAGRRVLLRGILRDSGRRPLSGALLRVLTRPRGAARFTDVAQLRTRPDGRFRLKLRPGPPRTVRVSYCAQGGGAARDLRLAVAATARVRAYPRALRNGQVVRFKGRVTARPVPRLGKLFELQAYFRGRWRTIETGRTNRRGRFTVRYRFGGTVTTVRYRFRIRVPREGGYAYDTGVSRSISVMVRGSRRR
jgi:hypothetical protein